MIRVREFLLNFVAKNPLFYCLVLFYLQRKRAQNVIRAGENLLHDLSWKYPYHSIAYQAKLENQYNPFPSSLQISFDAHLPTMHWSNEQAWNKGSLEVAGNVSKYRSREPEKTELEILYALLDAVRTINLLDLYISLTLGLIAFSTLGALLFI